MVLAVLGLPVFNMNTETKIVYSLIAAAIIMVFSIIISTTYNASESRKMYYACLEVAKQAINKETNENVRIVSLPYCRN